MSGKKPDPGQIDRAARLRKQIDKIKNEPQSGDSPKPGEQSGDQPKLSPRDFINKRMRELKDKK